MNSLLRLIDRIANWKSLLLFLAAYIFMIGFVLKNAEAKINEMAGQTVGVIDLTMGFDPQKTLAMVEAYGAEGRAYYARTEVTADILYPLIYSILFSIILMILYRNRSLRWTAKIPFLVLIFDFCENIFIVSLLINYPQQSLALANFCEAFKLLKWICFGLILLFMSIGLFMKFMPKSKTT
ncbi:MAG: hypothetical protein ABIV51_05680 [Saprospiraceae bacterium]